MTAPRRIAQPDQVRQYAAQQTRIPGLGRWPSGWVAAARKVHDQAALAAVHGEATAIRAMAMDAGCAVARGPAHQRAAW